MGLAEGRPCIQFDGLCESPDDPAVAGAIPGAKAGAGEAPSASADGAGSPAEAAAKAAPDAKAGAADSTPSAPGAGPLDAAGVADAIRARGYAAPPDDELRRALSPEQYRVCLLYTSYSAPRGSRTRRRNARAFGPPR